MLPSVFFSVQLLWPLQQPDLPSSLTAPMEPVAGQVFWPSLQQPDLFSSTAPMLPLAADLSLQQDEPSLQQAFSVPTAPAETDSLLLELQPTRAAVARQ